MGTARVRFDNTTSAELALLVVCTCTLTKGACRCRERGIQPGTLAFGRTVRHLAHDAGVDAIMLHRMLASTILNEPERYLRIPPMVRADIALALFDLYLNRRKGDVPEETLRTAVAESGISRDVLDKLVEERKEALGLPLM